MKSKLSILLCLIVNSLIGQDINKFFTEAQVTGGISIYDLKDKSWIHSNENWANKGSLPASTFKIFHTLIALEEEVISGKKDTISWDGEAKLFKKFKISNWNKDNDLEMAFKNSTVWYYEEISKQIKKRTYRKHLRKNGYSNRRNKNGKEFDFWNYGELKVSPIEQIKMLIKLHKNELSFKDTHQELTKDLMIEKETPTYILRSKTGWSYGKLDIGWYIGFLELENNVVFFATRIEKELDNQLKGFSKLRKSITKDIIYQLYKLNLNE